MHVNPGAYKVVNVSKFGNPCVHCHNIGAWSKDGNTYKLGITNLVATGKIRKVGPGQGTEAPTLTGYDDYMAKKLEEKGMADPQQGRKKAVEAIQELQECLDTVPMPEGCVITDAVSGFVLQSNPKQKYVFVTSTQYNGDFGGLAGADAKCTSLAATAGLPGTYKAWLSSEPEGINAKDRITDATYIRTDNQLVATNLADLTDGTIQRPINLDERRNQIDRPAEVLTGTNARGEIYKGNTCNGWTDHPAPKTWVSGGWATPLKKGYWTDFWSAYCPSPAHLYCFQQ